MQGIKPVLQTHHLPKPGTKYQVSGVLGPLESHYITSVRDQSSKPKPFDW